MKSLYVGLVMAAIGLSCGRSAAPEPKPAPEPSKTCGVLTGDTKADIDHLREFCDRGVLAGAVVGARASDALLWLQVPRELADAVRADRLSGEKMVQQFTSGWMSIVKNDYVIVEIEWDGVKIVDGQSRKTGITVTFKN